MDADGPAIFAPLYPPAAAFHRPAWAPFEFGVDTVTVAELVSTSATRAIIAELAPQLLPRAEDRDFQFMMTNVTLRWFATTGAVTPEVLARIDEKLRALPPASRPRL